MNNQNNLLKIDKFCWGKYLDFSEKMGKNTEKMLAFCLSQNEIIGIFGFSGSAKSNLCTILSGKSRKRREKYEGIELLEGQNLLALSRKTQIQLFVQKITIIHRASENNLDWQRTLEEQLRQIVELTDGELDEQVQMQRLETYGQQTGLTRDDWRKTPAQLSVSQRLWAALAMGLARHTKGYMIDEPFLALDTVGRRRFGQLLRQMAENGAGIIIFSEDREALEQICQRVISLDSTQPVPATICRPQKIAGDPPPTGGAPLLMLDDVFAGPAGQMVLKGISFEIRQGTCTGIVSAAVGGKTTLARTVAGLYPPQRGQLWWRGQLTDEPQAQQWQRQVRMVFQDAQTALNPSQTVEQTLREGLGNSRWWGGKGADREQVLAHMAFWGLPEELMHCKNEWLTAAQRRRLNAARAFCGKPALVVLDDCLRGIGAEERPFWLDRLRQVQRQEGTALLLITDEVVWHRELSRELLILYDGAIARRGDARELLHPSRWDEIQQFFCNFAIENKKGAAKQL